MNKRNVGTFYNANFQRP